MFVMCIKKNTFQKNKIKTSIQTMNHGTMLYINNAQTKITLIKMEINRIYVIYVIYAMCKLFNIKY